METAQIAISLFTAVLAFGGAIGGTLIGDKLRHRAWKREMEYQQKLEILQQRIKLTERAAAVLNKIDRAKTLQSFLDLEIDKSKLEAMSALRAKSESRAEQESDVGDQQKADSELVLRLSKEKIELSAELGAVAQLSSIYFGEKTTAAFRQLTSDNPWFEADIELVREVLKSMSAELLSFDFSPNKGMNLDPEKRRS